MRRNKTQTIDQVVKAYLKAMRIEGKMQEVKLRRIWPDIVGKSAAAKTRELRIHKGVLFVYLNSSVIRNELHMIRDALVKRVNEVMGEELIYDMVVR